MIVLFLFLLVAIAVIILANAKIVPQAHEYVIEFLGKYKTTWGAGFHIKIPLLERVAKKVTLKEQVLDSPPLAVKVHSKSLTDSGTIRTIYSIADDMCIFMKSNTLYLFIVNCVDLIWRSSKAVARVIVAIDAAHFLRGVAEKVFNLEIRRHIQYTANISEAAFLIGCNFRDILFGLGVGTIMEYVVVSFKLFHCFTTSVHR